MNDDFLTQHQREPRPEFQRALRDRLRQQEETPARTSGPSWARRWAPQLASAAALALVLVLLSFPAVRAAAQEFLELFRVRSFAAVPFDPERLAQLREGDVDLKSLMSDQIRVVKEPGAPQPVATIHEAGFAADMVPKLPTLVPPSLPQEPVIQVRGEGEAVLTGNTQKLEAILGALAIDDVEVPQALDGAEITVRMPAAVIAEYGENGVVLIQSRSPEVTLPPGTDLRQLGEIGLRIAGMSASEAQQFALSIDWNSTLLVPVPATATEFHEVGVQGHRGVFITSRDSHGAPAAEGKRRRSIVLWSDGETVYALSGAVAKRDLLAMANSLQ